MGNIPSYLQSPSAFTQCIRKPKPLSERQLIDIDFDDDFDDEEIIFYNRKDDSLKKKKKKKKNHTCTSLNDH